MNNKDKNKMDQREIRGMEEMYWRVAFQLKTAEEMQKDIGDPNVFDILYEPFELYTDVRKRNQMEILKSVVFELKKDFNDEFESLQKFKDDQVFSIKEKNELIAEILYNLKLEEELFEPQDHPLENPNLILETHESEIKVVKYLTKEERAVKEEEERKLREREEALKGDNVGQRGLKTMMGGTELNLKKEKNNMD